MTNNGAPKVQRTHTYALKREDYDRFFTPHRAMITSRGKALVEAARIMLEACEAELALRQRKRHAGPQRAFDRAVEAIICDLAHAELTEHYDGIAVPRSNQVLCRVSRYKPWFYSRHFASVLDLMWKADLTTQVIGKWRPNKMGQRTLIRPGHRLLELMADLGLTLSDIGRTTDGETIQLKGDDKKPQDYEDTEKSITWRKEMEAINKWIGSADITFDQACKLDGRYVDVTQRRLYRVFIHGSFDLHGRMYGGFWIPLEKAERLAGLCIDGQRVVGLDYGQAFPRIAYGLVGEHPPAGDLYLMPGLEAHREGIKKLMNSMLNHYRLLGRKPEGFKHLLPPEMTVKEIQELICQHHKPIAHMFGTYAGQSLTLIESTIMISVLLRLRELGVVALPIHDCIVVRQDHQAIATEVMADVFEGLTGVSPVVTPEHAESLDQEEYTIGVDEWSNDLCETFV